MILAILLAVIIPVGLFIMAVIAYGIWAAHRLTKIERVSVSGHPAMLEIPWEDATFPSRGDEILLSGWYLPAATDDRCIILIQGTDQHRNDPQIQALRLGRDLVERGFSVLLFDFRARGESEGKRSSEGDREQWDVLGAIDYVASRSIPVERVGLLGFSLGAGVAIMVAAQEPRIAAVVSDSGWLDYLTELDQLSLGPVVLPSWFGVFVVLAGRLLFKADFSKSRPASVVGEIKQPVFFIHGENDQVVPVQESEVLYSISANDDDRIWNVPGAEHVNVYRKRPEEYVNRVSTFFRRHIAQAGPNVLVVPADLETTPSPEARSRF